MQVIGGDGAFSSDNSSFIITIDNKKILFDCGPNAFNYVRENNLDIRDVYISHTHFDHIGGLEQLIFYNYFIKGNITRVYCADEVKEELKKILDVNHIYENGEMIDKTLFVFYNLSSFLMYPYSHKLIKGNHIVKPNYGLLLKNKEKRTALFISGDTKACSNIKNMIKEVALVQKYNLTIFHDYSYWNDPYKNIHCCESDFKYYYKELDSLDIKLKWYLYHNEKFNEKFNQKYKNQIIKI